VNHQARQRGRGHGELVCAVQIISGQQLVPIGARGGTRTSWHPDASRATSCRRQMRRKACRGGLAGLGGHTKLRVCISLKRRQTDSLLTECLQRVTGKVHTNTTEMGIQIGTECPILHAE
jgi:hypothetical protein